MTDIDNLLFEELKSKYKNIRFSPNPECKRCEGKGETYAAMQDNSIRAMPCMCLYFDRDTKDTIIQISRSQYR